jgi:hypothetical protein
MNIALWIAQALLGFVMIAAGSPKLLAPRAWLAEKMGWTKNVHPALPRLLGFAEILGGLGLILPRLLGIAPILTPVAAGCLFFLLIGATATKLRDHESLALPVVCMLLAAFIVVGRVLPPTQGAHVVERGKDANGELRE